MLQESYPQEPATWIIYRMSITSITAGRSHRRRRTLAQKALIWITVIASLLTIVSFFAGVDLSSILTKS